MAGNIYSSTGVLLIRGVVFHLQIQIQFSPSQDAAGKKTDQFLTLLLINQSLLNW